jgi:hypothetical protein
MKRTRRTLVALAVALAVSSTLAFYDIQSDRLEQVGGMGVAIVYVVDDIYAQVYYIDSDANGHYSEGDTRLRTVYFRA